MPAPIMKKFIADIYSYGNGEVKITEVYVKVYGKGFRITGETAGVFSWSKDIYGDMAKRLQDTPMAALHHLMNQSRIDLAAAEQKVIDRQQQIERVRFAIENMQSDMENAS